MLQENNKMNKTTEKIKAWYNELEDWQKGFLLGCSISAPICLAIFISWILSVLR